MQVKYKCVHNFIAVGCVFVQGVEGGFGQLCMPCGQDRGGGKIFSFLRTYYMDDPLLG